MKKRLGWLAVSLKKAMKRRLISLAQELDGL